MYYLYKKKKENRINKNNPAVTRVEECTKAEIGVGADIAKSNHLEKGKIAVFVKKAIIIHPNKEIEPTFKLKNII